ncbi:MAG: pentapeptide repeat-containing protein, partial [Chthonomonadaceae bacterium]|nr:pentapeptide repeat-containing protein [Chthonomonadaceae bacterium]
MEEQSGPSSIEKQPSPWLTIETQGALYRPKLDPQKMALALFHAAKNVATVKWVALAADAEETFKALGLKPQLPALAAFLLQRAVTHAFQQIVEENRYRFAAALPDEPKTLAFFSREYTGRSTTPLNKDFFQRPHQLDFLTEIAKPFREWLTACGVPEAEALRLAEIRLPLMVLTALSDEWRSNAEFYKPLLSA